MPVHTILPKWQGRRFLPEGKMADSPCGIRFNFKHSRTPITVKRFHRPVKRIRTERPEALRRTGGAAALAFCLAAIMTFGGCSEGTTSARRDSPANVAAQSFGPTETKEPRATESPDSWPPIVTLDGQNRRLFDSEDRFAAMIFVLPDCPIANSYAPEIGRLHAWLAERNIPLYLAYVDSEMTDDAAMQHAKDYALNLPALVDRKHEWARRAGATRTPEAVLFSSSGEIMYRGRIDDRYAALGKRRPEATEHFLKDAVEDLLAGRSVKQPRTEAVGCPIPFLSAGE
jgi:hypothetical protein